MNNGYSFEFNDPDGKFAKALSGFNKSRLSKFSDIQLPPGLYDMSSTELHVTNGCPLCDHVWMDKVKEKGECPECKTAYTMTTCPDGNVQIIFSFQETVLQSQLLIFPPDTAYYKNASKLLEQFKSGRKK